MAGWAGSSSPSPPLLGSEDYPPWTWAGNRRALRGGARGRLRRGKAVGFRAVDAPFVVPGVVVGGGRGEPGRLALVRGVLDIAIGVMAGVLLGACVSLGLLVLVESL